MRRGFHSTEDVGVEQVLGLGHERSVDRNVVGDRYQLGEIHAFDPSPLHGFFGDEGIVADNSETKSFGLVGNELRNSAKSNQPQDTASQTMNGNQAGYLPAACVRARIGEGNLTRQGQE